jgi:hypothetical protein
MKKSILKHLKNFILWCRIQIDKTDHWESLQNSRTRYENSIQVPPVQKTKGPSIWKTTKDGITTNHLT